MEIRPDLVTVGGERISSLFLALLTLTTFTFVTLEVNFDIKLVPRSLRFSLGVEWRETISLINIFAMDSAV